MGAKIVLLGKGLNLRGWKPIIEFLEQSGHQCDVLQHHKDIEPGYDIGILLGYTRILPKKYLQIPSQGFVLFHSADLPRGRGWAPIYYTISKSLDLVQTMLYADEEADLGNVLAKARYQLEGDEMEAEVKKFDDQLTLKLIEACMDEVISNKPVGLKQNPEEGSWWERRRPKDSEISPDNSIADVFDHMRGLPSSVPAFFDYRGRRFILNLVTLEGDEKVFKEESFCIEKYY